MKKRKIKTNLYVDGSNIYGAQWELFGPKKYLDFSSVIEVIEKIYPLNKIYFYASYSPLPKSKHNKPPLYILNERLFYHSARKHSKVIFYTGHRSKTSGKEKGVDMHLGCDIVEHSITRKVDQIILMSGDADLVYPLEIAKKYYRKTIVITYPNRLMLNVSKIVHIYYILNLFDKPISSQINKTSKKAIPNYHIIPCDQRIKINTIKAKK